MNRIHSLPGIYTEQNPRKRDDRNNDHVRVSEICSKIKRENRNVTQEWSPAHELKHLFEHESPQGDAQVLSHSQWQQVRRGQM